MTRIYIIYPLSTPFSIAPRSRPGRRSRAALWCGRGTGPQQSPGPTHTPAPAPADPAATTCPPADTHSGEPSENNLGQLSIVCDLPRPLCSTLRWRRNHFPRCSDFPPRFLWSQSSAAAASPAAALSAARRRRCPCSGVLPGFPPSLDVARTFEWRSSESWGRIC